MNARPIVRDPAAAAANPGRARGVRGKDGAAAGTDRNVPVPPPPGVSAYTIPEFCFVHRISLSHYYELKRQRPSRAPFEMHLGARILVSIESAAEWRAAETNRTRAANDDLPAPDLAVNLQTG